MPLIFQGQDNRFAVSTGANVNSSLNTSNFDTLHGAGAASAIDSP